MPTTVGTILPHHRQDEEDTYQLALLVEMHADVDVLDHSEDALQVQCGMHILRRSLLLGECEELRERHCDSGLAVSSGEVYDGDGRRRVESGRKGECWKREPQS